ncbi:MAG TPA: prepilin-type N-terminal cleavage/methylation domain-containing protein [Candidatus Dormibacteraeota bacterium]|nr:prepilin-type N-terminal cleavage/methylation domain-containing protein [Candidatus Dormibacteraeota bacterium]
MRDRRGFTLIEVMVAMCLFALGAAALAETLVVAQRVRASSARWGRAVALAEERLELLRAGDRGDDPAPIGEFTRAWRREAFDGGSGLDRIDVSVDWEDRGHQRFTLTALLRRR